MLVAAGAAAAIVLRRRKGDRTLGAPGEAAEEGTGSQAAQDGQLHAGTDGTGVGENVSGQSQAT
jgi:hypothetical protein